MLLADEQLGSILGSLPKDSAGPSVGVQSSFSAIPPKYPYEDPPSLPQQPTTVTIGFGDVTAAPAPVKIMGVSGENNQDKFWQSVCRYAVKVVCANL